jgi:hypothetical protein
VDVRTDRQIRAALARAKPGDEIRVHPGTYRGGLTLRRSGTAEHPIVIRGIVPAREATKPAWEARGLPVIDGRGKTYNGLLLEGTPEKLIRHVVLDHLQVRNAKEVGVHLHRAAWCVVQHCQIYDNGKYVNLHVNKGGAEGGRHLIQFNHIADLKHGRLAITHEEQPGVTYYGFKQDNYVGPGTIFRGNRVEGHSDGICPSGDEDDANKVAETLDDVRARWFNHSMDIYNNLVRDHADDAIESDGVAINQRVFHNRFYRAQNAISISPAMPGPFFFFANLARDFFESSVKLNTRSGRGVIRNAYFYHNVFARGRQLVDGAASGAIMTLWSGTPSKNIVYRNNIFTGTRALFDFQGLPHRPDMDYDLWFTTKGRGPVKAARARFERAGVSWERHGLFADPKLKRSLKPRLNSAVRDRGVVIPGINTRYVGRAPDIGAFEMKRR